MHFAKIVIGLIGYTSGIIGAAAAALAGSALSRRSSSGSRDLGFLAPERDTASFNDREIHFRDDGTSYIGTLDPEAEYILSDDEERYYERSERLAPRYKRNADMTGESATTQNPYAGCCSASVNFKERECEYLGLNGDGKTYGLRVKRKNNDIMLKVDATPYDQTGRNENNYKEGKLYFFDPAENITVELNANLGLDNFICIVGGRRIVKQDLSDRDICRHDVENNYVSLSGFIKGASATAYPAIIDPNDPKSRIILIAQGPAVNLSEDRLWYESTSFAKRCRINVNGKAFNPEQYFAATCSETKDYLILQNAYLQSPVAAIFNDDFTTKWFVFRRLNHENWIQEKDSHTWYSFLHFNISTECLDQDLRLNHDSSRLVSADFHSVSAALIGGAFVIAGVLLGVLYYFKRLRLSSNVSFKRLQSIHIDAEGVVNNAYFVNEDDGAERMVLSTRESLSGEFELCNTERLQSHRINPEDVVKNACFFNADDRAEQISLNPQESAQVDSSPSGIQNNTQAEVLLAKEFGQSLA